MQAAFFIVRATVTDPSKRAAFDTWYATEHLPDAVKCFGARKAWRFWSLTDPSVHQATYEFADQASLDRAIKRDRDEAARRRLQPRLAGGDTHAGGAGAGAGVWGELSFTAIVVPA
jgi:hypothetical protein